jgi:hypothetical protein
MILDVYERNVHRSESPLLVLDNLNAITKYNRSCVSHCDEYPEDMAVTIGKEEGGRMIGGASRVPNNNRAS